MISRDLPSLFLSEILSAKEVPLLGKKLPLQKGASLL
jgi:hypothetical protein